MDLWAYGPVDLVSGDGDSNEIAVTNTDERMPQEVPRITEFAEVRR